MDASPERSKRDLAARFAIAALLLACLGEAVSFPLMKAFALRATLVAPGVSGWFVSACLLAGRFLCAALALLLFGKQRPTRDELVQGLWIGGFAAFGHLLQTDGLTFTDASTSAFLTQGYVVVLPLLAAVESRHWLARRVGVAVAVNLLGLAILARFDPRSMRLGRGEAETLLAACLFAGQIFSISRPRYEHNRAGPVSFVMFLASGAAPLLLATASGSWSNLTRLGSSAELWSLLGVLTLASTLLPFLLMNRFQRYVSSSEAGVIYGAEPVLASLLALFLPALLSPLAGIRYFNETLSPRLVIGALLITLAPFLIRVRRSDADAAAASNALS